MRSAIREVRGGHAKNGVNLGMGAYRDTAADKLALAAEPLTLGYKGNAIALLMHREIAAIAKHNRISILTITVVANRTFRVGFFTSICRLTINCRS